MESVSKERVCAHQTSAEWIAEIKVMLLGEAN